MCSGLAEAVEGLELDGSGAELADVLAAADVLASKICMAVGSFDRGGEWELDGFTSAIAWLRGRGRLGGGEASMLVRTAKRLRSLPVTSEAWGSGSLSRAQVGAVMANVKDKAMDLFASHEAEVIPLLTQCSVVETASVMQLWAARAAAMLDEPGNDEPERSLHVSATLDGRTEISGSLDAESGEIVATAIRMAETKDVEGEPQRCPATRRADALTDICRAFLNNQNSDTGGRNRPHLNVVVNFEDFEGGDGGGSILGGPLLDASAVRRLLCDAGVHRVITSGRSSVLDYGATTQAISAPLWAALVIRDRHCRFPGCDRPPKWCDGHHLDHYSDGGETNLKNLAMLCSRHHHLLHRRRWSAQLQDNGDLVVTTNDGRVLRSTLADAQSLPLAG